ncbi:MAG TPA: ferritin-like protein [Thermoanaerobaculia bacterium]|jgi:hypothetical protein
MTIIASQELTIAALLDVPEADRDLEWVAPSLSLALSLEMATLPPYLAMLWSISDEGPAKSMIWSILEDEMCHMGLVCNMISSLGFKPPVIASVPKYDGPLPGGVSPKLIVHLAPLSKSYLKDVAMEIEMPEKPLAEATGFPTIGKFYEALREALERIRPVFKGERQLTSSIGSGVTPIRNLAEAVAAIERIATEGEGTTSSGCADPGCTRLAHYYAFGSIYHGKTFEKKDGKWGYTGAPVPFPAVRPVARIPSGGWSGDVPQKVRDFRVVYRQMLQDLEEAWAIGSKEKLSAAIRAMRGMTSIAEAIMTIRVPGQDKVYGPDFLI